jgi:hypothetical protein
MKYIITESKLEETIMNYFDEIFDIQDLHWTHPYDILDDETEEEGEDENRIEFYIGDYADEETCFRWYACNYFNHGSPARDLCPELFVENPYATALNGYFDDMWKEPLKKWIKFYFDLPVKTVTYW